MDVASLVRCLILRYCWMTMMLLLLLLLLLPAAACCVRWVRTQQHVCTGYDLLRTVQLRVSYEVRTILCPPYTGTVPEMPGEDMQTDWTWKCTFGKIHCIFYRISITLTLTLPNRLHINTNKKKQQPPWYRCCTLLLHIVQVPNSYATKATLRKKNK